MADLVLVTVVLAFTALCVLYIAWCDRIIGPDDFTADAPSSATAVADDSPSVVSHERVMS